MVKSQINHLLKNNLLRLSFMNNRSSIKSLIYGIIILNIFDKITEIIPKFINFIKLIILNYFKKKFFKDSNNGIKNLLIEYISSIDDVKFVKYNNIYIITNKDALYINK